MDLVQTLQYNNGKIRDYVEKKLAGMNYARIERVDVMPVSTFNKDTLYVHIEEEPDMPPRLTQFGVYVEESECLAIYSADIDTSDFVKVADLQQMLIKFVSTYPIAQHIANATQQRGGLMSKEDKTKLDNMSTYTPPEYGALPLGMYLIQTDRNGRVSHAQPVQFNPTVEKRYMDVQPIDKENQSSAYDGHYYKKFYREFADKDIIGISTSNVDFVGLTIGGNAYDVVDEIIQGNRIRINAGENYKFVVGIVDPADPAIVELTFDTAVQ